MVPRKICRATRISTFGIRAFCPVGKARSHAVEPLPAHEVSRVCSATLSMPSSDEQLSRSSWKRHSANARDTIVCIRA